MDATTTPFTTQPGIQSFLLIQASPGAMKSLSIPFGSRFSHFTSFRRNAKLSHN